MLPLPEVNPVQMKVLMMNSLLGGPTLAMAAEGMAVAEGMADSGGAAGCRENSGEMRRALRS